jgi:uncharacterized protein
MKIDIAKLSQDRELEFLDEWDSKKSELDAPGLNYKTPLKIRVQARKESGLAIAEVSTSARALMTCARCFKEFEVSLDKSFRLVYSLDLAQKVIPLDDDIREELILNYPQKILCQQDCQGLCPRCGTDLNENNCDCIGKKG